MSAVGSEADRGRRVVGCMTGTSMDGIDAALVEVRGTGLAMKPRFVRGASRGFGESAEGRALQGGLRALAERQAMTAERIAGLSRDLALAHVEVIREVLDADGGGADLVCVHGQTVFHKPPVSWQLMNPSVIAHGLKTPVVCDLRGADLAAGGQGAPITPIADAVWFGAIGRACGVVNLGGFCNATRLEGGAVAWAGDVCVCNLLLDAIAREVLGVAIDLDGAIARSGVVHAGATSDLRTRLSDPAKRGRSLGTGDEVFEWIGAWKQRLPAADLAASAVEAIAGTIAEGLRGVELVLLAGGGAHHLGLVEAMKRALAAAAGRIVRVGTTDEFGLPGQYREAAEFAVLGALCQDRVPITLAGVTGVTRPEPIAGVWALV